MTVRSSSLRRLFSTVVVISILLLTIAAPASAAPAAAPPADHYAIAVDAIDDDNPTGGCTLREALADANAGRTTGTNGCTVTTVGSPGSLVYAITMPAGLIYTLNGSELIATANTIYIVGNGSIIQASTTAPNRDNTIDAGEASHRVFQNNGSTLELADLTVRHGNCTTASGSTCVNRSFSGGGLLTRRGTTTLDGVTVTANNGNEGGGLFSESNTIIQNASIFTDNTSVLTGGGISVFAGSATLDASTVSSNRGGSGGGIHVNESPASLTIQNNSVVGGSGTPNHASGNGGGIYNVGTLTVTSSMVSFNTCGNNGGGLENYGTATFTDSSITGNDANALGGGIHIDHMFVATSSVRLEGTTVTDNEARRGGGAYVEDGTLEVFAGSAIGDPVLGGNRAVTSGSYSINGGGIFIDTDGTAVIDASIVSSNTVPLTSSGPGITSWGTLTIQNGSVIENHSTNGAGAGLELDISSVTTITDSTLRDNRASLGGAIFLDSGSLTINNTLFGGTGHANSAITRGGAIYSNGGRYTITNSRFFENTAPTNGGGAIYINSGNVASSITSSCIVNNTSDSTRLALLNDDTETRSATGNWWGAATGADTTGADTTSGPWDTSGHLTTAPSGCPLGAGQGEISILGNSIEIVDGDTSASATDDTDFGDVPVGGSEDHIFTINNSGIGDLLINSIAFVGTNPGDFSIVTSPTSPVASSGSTTFTVRFSPSALGNREAVIRVHNDDADETPYNFELAGNGIEPPEISISGNSIEIGDGDTTPTTADDTDFGDVSTGSTVDHIFTIVNNGASDLTIGSVSLTGSTDFSVIAQPATTLAPSGSTTFTVRFAPTATGAQTAGVSIPNSDPDEDPYDFILTGATPSPSTGDPSAFDPAASKSGAPLNATIGEEVIWTINVWNPNAEAVNAVLVNDPIASIFDITAVSTTGTYAINGQVVTVDLGVLQPGQEEVIQITTVANATAPEGAACNSAVVSHAAGTNSAVSGCVTLLPGVLPDTGGEPESNNLALIAVLTLAGVTAGVLLKRHGEAH